VVEPGKTAEIVAISNLIPPELQREGQEGQGSARWAVEVETIASSGLREWTQIEFAALVPEEAGQPYPVLILREGWVKPEEGTQYIQLNLVVQTQVMMMSPEPHAIDAIVLDPQVADALPQRFGEFWTKRLDDIVAVEDDVVPIGPQMGLPQSDVWKQVRRMRMRPGEQMLLSIDLELKGETVEQWSRGMTLRLENEIGRPLVSRPLYKLLFPEQDERLPE